MDTIGGFKIEQEPKIEPGQETQTPETGTNPPEGGQPSEGQKPWWSEQFESEDKVREVVSQYGSLQSEVTELKAKLEQNPFKAPAVEALNDFIGQNEGVDINDAISRFANVYGRDFDGMDPMDTIKQSLIINEGFSPRQVDDYVMAELTAPKKLTAEELEDLSQDERSSYDRGWATYRIKVDREHRKAKESLNQAKESLKPRERVTKSPEQIAQENQARVETVRAAASGLSISLNAGDYGDIQFTPTEDQVRQIEEAFAQVPVGGDLNSAMGQYAKAAFFDKIMHKVISDIKAKEAANTHAELSNANPGNAQPPTQTGDPDKQLAENIGRVFRGY